ncbi:MAG: D-2-hydroxyacid dehydrogenase [Anaerolineae bacterium]
MPTHPVHVLSTLGFEEHLLEKLGAVSPRLVVRQKTCHNEDEVAAALDATVEVLYTYHVPRDLSTAAGLRWVQLHTAGADHLLGHPILSPGQPWWVTTASGVHASSVGEFVLGCILALNRRIPLMTCLHRDREWPTGRWKRFSQPELRGQTMGILGYGSIGREVGRLATAFGMRILALKFDPKRREDRGYVPAGLGDPKGVLPERFYGPEERLEMLAQSDFVVVALPLTAATRGFVGEAELRSMKPTAYFINIARGQLVDEPALVRALREGWIAGAALDVFAQEPLSPDSPLWDMDPCRVILSPHVAGFSLQYNDRASDLFAENLRRYLAGEPLLNLVDRNRQY